MNRLFVLLLAFFAMFPAAILPAAGMDIREITSPKGIKAWFVEDHTLPVIALRFAFEGGSAQDPAGKEGLARLMSSLFDEGAGDLDSDAFQEQIDAAGGEMGFSAARDAIYGSMRVLSDDAKASFALLALAVNSPRFDQAPLDRIRSQILASIEADSRDPEKAASKLWGKALYGDHPYSRERDGTPVSLAAIMPDDLRAFRAAQFGRSNLIVSVVGDIDEAALKALLDQVFGGLPEKPALAVVADVTPRLGQTLAVPFDLPQTKLVLAWPGVARDDPDFFAAFLMNHIYGGGSFSSRLFNEVREKRGLAYGVDSSLATQRHANSLMVSTATRSDRAAETLSIIRAEAAKLAEGGPTEQEMADAKDYLAGSYAINNLVGSASIASTLTELQLSGQAIDYISRRESLIRAVTPQSVQAMAKRLLLVDPAILAIGPQAVVDTLK
ncbi:MAG: pitrilysin family protein [Rhizobiaceae bacterium]